MKQMISGLVAFWALQAAQAQAGECVVQIAGLRSNTGQCILYLYADSRGFPADSKTAMASAKAPIRDGRATAIFKNVPPGEYAVSVVHDENNNGKLDTGLLGIPREGIGTSNNARSTIGPPGFDDSRFSMAPKVNSISITMKYL